MIVKNWQMFPNYLRDSDVVEDLSESFEGDIYSDEWFEDSRRDFLIPFIVPITDRVDSHNNFMYLFETVNKFGKRNVCINLYIYAYRNKESLTRYITKKFMEILELEDENLREYQDIIRTTHYRNQYLDKKYLPLLPSDFGKLLYLLIDIRDNITLRENLGSLKSIRGTEDIVKDISNIQNYTYYWNDEEEQGEEIRYIAFKIKIGTSIIMFHPTDIDMHNFVEEIRETGSASREDEMGAHESFEFITSEDGTMNFIARTNTVAYTIPFNEEEKERFLEALERFEVYRDENFVNPDEHIN